MERTRARSAARVCWCAAAAAWSCSLLPSGVDGSRHRLPCIAGAGCAIGHRAGRLVDVDDMLALAAGWFPLAVRLVAALVVAAGARARAGRSITAVESHTCTLERGEGAGGRRAGSSPIA